jgi:hypothetical protein
MAEPKERKPLVEAVEEFWSEALARVESKVEAAVKQSLQRVQAPTRDEVAKLSARLDALNKRIEALK